MRENRTYGSEGGEAKPLPDPYHAACDPSPSVVRDGSLKMVGMRLRRLAHPTKLLRVEPVGEPIDDQIPYDDGSPRRADRERRLARCLKGLVAESDAAASLGLGAAARWSTTTSRSISPFR